MDVQNLVQSKKVGAVGLRLTKDPQNVMIFLGGISHYRHLYQMVPLLILTLEILLLMILTHSLVIKSYSKLQSKDLLHLIIISITHRLTTRLSRSNSIIRRMSSPNNLHQNWKYKMYQSTNMKFKFIQIKQLSRFNQKMQSIIQMMSETNLNFLLKQYSIYKRLIGYWLEVQHFQDKI